MIETAPASYNLMTYDEAVMYCAFCRHDGLSDWRLPTVGEYITLRYNYNLKINDIINQNYTRQHNDQFNNVWHDGLFDRTSLTRRVVPVRNI